MSVTLHNQFEIYFYTVHWVSILACVCASTCEASLCFSVCVGVCIIYIYVYVLYIYVYVLYIYVYGSSMARQRHCAKAPRHSALLAKWCRWVKIVTFSAKKSRGCYHHSDMWRFPAILWEKSDDFCYNRDEKRPKRRVSRVLSNPQVVGNAITSTIATLHRHKKG